MSGAVVFTGSLAPAETILNRICTTGARQPRVITAAGASKRRFGLSHSHGTDTSDLTTVGNIWRVNLPCSVNKAVN